MTHVDYQDGIFWTPIWARTLNVIRNLNMFLLLLLALFLPSFYRALLLLSCSLPYLPWLAYWMTKL